MKVLIVGSGGREHALAWKASQSQTVTQIFVAPGNGGTAQEPNVTNVAISSSNINELAKFANLSKNKIDLVVIGSRGRSSAKELFFGSTSQFVLHKSKPPVLVIK